VIDENEGRIVVPPHLVNLKLGNRQFVTLGGGRSFGTWTMTEILAKAGLIPGLDSHICDRLREDKMSLAHLQHTGLVWDVMNRYGEDITKRQEQCTDEAMELLKVDQYKRSLAMMAEVRQIKNIIQGIAVDATNSLCDTYTMSLTVKEASGLPKMDLLHGIDSYCVVSVDDLQDEVYQTKVIPKDRNPVWNANFEWTVPMQTELLTIAVVDHYTITEDDLVSPEMHV
jgi:hypothetical protein